MKLKLINRVIPAYAGYNQKKDNTNAAGHPRQRRDAKLSITH
jgi:hypothetical protein